MDFVNLPILAYDFSIFFFFLSFFFFFFLPTLPAVHDFSASICPRFTKFGTQLPHDNPPRGISIYFEIPIFYRLFGIWKSALDLENFPLPVGTGYYKGTRVLPLPFSLGLPNQEYSYHMTIPPEVFGFISKFLFFIEFLTLEICSGLRKCFATYGYYEVTMDWTFTSGLDFDIGFWLRDWTLTLRFDFDFGIGLWLWDWTLTLGLDFEFGLPLWVWTLTFGLDLDFWLRLGLWDWT